VEIYVPSLGWIVVDPTPTKTGAAPAQANSGGPTTTTVPQKQPHSAATPGNSGHSEAPHVNLLFDKHSKSLMTFLAVIVLLAFLVVSVPALVEFMKARRRRRRRSGPGASRQVERAWLETLDVLYEANVSGLSPLTNSEVASLVNHRFNAEVRIPVAALAAQANEVVFSTHLETDPDAGGQAWSEFDAFRRSLKSHQSGRERLRCRLRLAPKVRS
jgi:hypothetical protein